MDSLGNATLRWGLVFGRCFAVTDMPRLSVDDVPSSAAEARKRGLRPYTYLVTPLELEDWAVDEYGQFRWARLAESEPDARAPGEPWDNDKTGKQYRIWTRDRWELWRVQRAKSGKVKLGKYELAASAPHDLGVVPIEPFFADHTEQRNRYDSDTPFASVLDGDVQIYNLMSLLDEQEHASTFPQMVFEDDGSGADIESGPGIAIPYAQGGRPPGYIQPDPATAAGLMLRIIQRIRLIRESTGETRGVAEQSKEERSASALSIEYQNRYAMLSQLASQIEDYEPGIFRHVAAWMGETEVPRTRLSRRFDLRSVSEQIRDVTAMGSLDLPAAAIGAINSGLIDRVLKDMGLSSSERVEISKETRNWAFATRTSTASTAPE